MGFGEARKLHLARVPSKQGVPKCAETFKTWGVGIKRVLLAPLILRMRRVWVRLGGQRKGRHNLESMNIPWQALAKRRSLPPIRQDEALLPRLIQGASLDSFDVAASRGDCGDVSAAAQRLYSRALRAVDQALQPLAPGRELELELGPGAGGAAQGVGRIWLWVNSNGAILG